MSTKPPRTTIRGRRYKDGKGKATAAMRLESRMKDFQALMSSPATEQWKKSGYHKPGSLNTRKYT